MRSATSSESDTYTNLQLLLAVTTLTNEVCKPAIDVSGAKGIKRCPHYKHVLCLLLRRSVDRWQNREFVTPEERHGVVRSIVQAFFLLDEKCGACRGCKLFGGLVGLLRSSNSLRSRRRSQEKAVRIQPPRRAAQ